MAAVTAGEPCSGKAAQHHPPVIWSPVWDQWLCVVCLMGRTEAELRMHRTPEERQRLMKAKVV